jgi:hypothetical protein
VTDTRDAKVSDLRPDRRNANKGTQRGLGALDHSLRSLGAGRSILIDKNGNVIAGNKTLERAADIGLDDVIIVQTDGTKIVAVQRTDLDLYADPAARELAYADNRVGQLDLEWDLDEIKIDIDAGIDLSHFFSPEDLSALANIKDVSGVQKGKKPNARKLPIDVIYTLQMADCTCCLAVQAGLKYGIQSAHYRLCPYTYELSGRHEVAFIDNDYFKYDHAKHVKAVAELKPKYCTVRDAMTKSQCDAAGIEYYSLEQILDWAEELSQSCENVIVIPKYAEALDLIPDKFMLGYSVPTSHGGTPLPAESFRGRRIHLLGGSWKAQLAYMAELEEDVVSLDNNYIALVASQFGQFTDTEGEMKQLGDAGLGGLNNPRYAALALSFGAIGAKVNQLYGSTGIPADQEQEQEKTE